MKQSNNSPRRESMENETAPRRPRPRLAALGRLALVLGMCAPGASAGADVAAEIAGMLDEAAAARTGDVEASIAALGGAVLPPVFDALAHGRLRFVAESGEEEVRPLSPVERMLLHGVLDRLRPEELLRFLRGIALGPLDGTERHLGVRLFAKVGTGHDLELVTHLTLPEDPRARVPRADRDNFQRSRN
jgi:hypothetical protein